MKFRKINAGLSYGVKGKNVLLQISNPRRDAFIIPLIKESSEAILKLIQETKVDVAERRLAEYGAALAAVLNLFEISLLVSLKWETNNNIFSNKVRDGLIEYVRSVYGMIGSREEFEKHLIEESVRRLVEGDQDG